MKKKYYIYIIGLFFCLLLGCRTVKFVAFDDIERKPTEKIRIFSDEHAAKQEYTEIGLLTVREKSEDRAISKFQIKAREIGADAIILQEPEHRGTYHQKFFGSYISKRKIIYRAIAIIFENAESN